MAGGQEQQSRDGHMGRSLAEAEIPQIKAWLVVASTLLLLACSLVAAGAALFIR